MSSYQNKAIYLDSQGNYSIRTITEPYTPTASQSLLKVHYSAINPADARHYYMGLSEFVAGYEFVGTVLETGPESPFKVGQDVFGFALPGDHRPLYLGAHQDYLLAEESFTFVRPDDMDRITAVTLPVGAMTAIDALFNMLGFGFTPADLEGDNAAGVPILIWGGSSTVGQAAIQLAKAAGCYPVLTTASPNNHEALREIGATQCFDYRSKTMVDDIQAAMKSYGKKLTHVFDTVTTGLGLEGDLAKDQGEKTGADTLSSPDLARQSCDPDTPANELNLCASLYIPDGSGWKFALLFRTVETMEHAVGASDWDAEQRKLEEAKVRRYGSRIDKVIKWLIANHRTHWQPPRTRIVKGAEEGIQAIHDVWNGKTSREKIVISRPL